VRTQQLQIDPSIDWLPIATAASLLGLHASQVRRDRALLSELGLIDYTRKGLRREAFECIQIFRGLVTERGRPEAINTIEEKWNGR
jgi:hypothetical protein